MIDDSLFLSMITIYLNGVEHALSTPTSVAQLLTQLSMEEARLAVEINETIVPRSQYELVQVSANDQVEIIQAVGGG